MIGSLFNKWFDTSHYSDRVERNRARTIQAITFLMLLLYLIFATFRSHPVTGNNIWEEVAAGHPLWTLAVPLYALISIFTLWAVRTGRLAWASLGPTAMWYLGIVVTIAPNGFLNAQSGLTLLVLVMLAGLMHRERGLVIGTLVALGTLVAGITLRDTLPNPPPPQQDIHDFFTVTLQLMGGAGAMALFLYYARLERSQATEKVQSSRLQLAEITAQVARNIAERTALDDVLASAVELISTHYPDVYHAQIFLVDSSGQEAQLVASSGEVGKQLLERQHRLGVGSVSVIGQVTLTGQRVVARAGAPRSLLARNELLPDTRIEAAFPLLMGGKVMGALDLQSKGQSAFLEEDAPLFQSLADHIAIAIDNARLAEQTEQRLDENRRLVEQTREAMAEVERLNQWLTGQAWTDYGRQKGSEVHLKMDFEQDQVEQVGTWTPALAEAIQRNNVVQRQDDGMQVVAVPLRVRGRVIGAMEFEMDKSAALSAEDLLLVMEVGERFGLAVENTRLFEESQRLAQREALVNEISARLQTTNNVEDTLAEAARGLKQSLKASKVAIRLGPPPG